MSSGTWFGSVRAIIWEPQFQGLNKIYESTIALKNATHVSLVSSTVIIHVCTTYIYIYIYILIVKILIIRKYENLKLNKFV